MTHHGVSNWTSRLPIWVLVMGLVLGVLLPVASSDHADAGVNSFSSAPIPTISGTVTVGSTLTANPGTWKPSAALSYQWKRDGKPIAGATSKTYKIPLTDAGKPITVTVTGRKSGYKTTSKTSSKKTPPQLSFSAAPTPTISGTTKVGSTLTAKPGTWKPSATLTYQWKRDGKPISGATKPSYKLTAADAGKPITVTVTGTKVGYKTTSETSSKKLIANSVWKVTSKGIGPVALGSSAADAEKALAGTGHSVIELCNSWNDWAVVAWTDLRTGKVTSIDLVGPPGKDSPKTDAGITLGTPESTLKSRGYKLIRNDDLHWYSWTENGTPFMAEALSGKVHRLSVGSNELPWDYCS
ncbi:hypothetical protein [Microbacterium sp. NPDC076895]|uniref:hypothetical protein n=1 Tax=Microbacterium sp. NPDC076895 TaxID=3154957 RepID=UPI0034160E4A